MACYGYQYKQHCYIPCGVKCTTPVLTPHQNPGAVKYVSCTPCASKGVELCTVRKTTQGSPKCSTPCSSQHVQTHIVEDHSSSCSHRSPAPGTMAFPQPHVQGRGHLCVPHFGQPGITGYPQARAPSHMYRHSSCPYSYQWSNSYHYHCGQQ